MQKAAQASSKDAQHKPLDESGLKVYLRLLGYIRSSWFYFALSVFGFVLYSAMEPAQAWILKHIVDVVSNNEIAENRLLIPLAILVIFIIRGLGTFLGSYFMALIANKVVYDLRTSMFEKMVVLPSNYFHSMPSGRLLSKITYDTEQVTGSVTSAIKVILREGFTVVGLLGYMLYINWKLSLLFLIILPVIGLVVSYASKRFRKLSKRIQGAMGGVTDVASEAIKGQEVVKIFGGIEYETKRFRDAAHENRRSQLKMELTKALNTPIVQFLVAISLSGLIWLALDPTFSDNMSSGDFVSFITAAGMLSKPMRQLTEVNSILQKGIAAAQSIFEFIDMDEEVDQGKRRSNSLKGEIRWEDVRFQYPSSDKLALNDVSLTLEAGKTLALVGRSGGGKSTIASLIPRFYDVTGGRLLIDGHEIQDYDLTSLRDKIALVNQNVVLFNGTIRENIAYGRLRNTPDQKIIDAAKAANALDFIQELENGFDTVVGENGVLLSGGQRQRIAIARAILKNAPILILDEATSALDSESERAIQQALDTLMENRTTIAIAHRLSTIEKADMIAVIDHGEIVEVGTHSELLEKDGAYAQLHKQQFAE
ncbi:lipid A export permease/ATP-binding protein MsbA [Marinomonas mediterranea]|jgi:lipid A export permease/ATP-binding protein MsbA|uniref:Lipid A ABC exporter, fused ATPase and inner membrane subunits MsbA n=1 Tax=Marinomonas mediterranea (strain ATCC 700492 / JCM 21426 / NBRC 103028 / MMB-1) TaxID=717774 RepID=F2K451_MARM1|nr:lipid A export permease/ATP-binding protein MsbA [Marinomonas mediterranea]ADZ92492.1 lipid A ABC exporter, fused ATPase and inner membrane subunits MsbA [Marinomonas mediterranea MMB-1]WCN10438.1 lipid A export permease/ATP-binding protein MsbA [Marinomonas mediterranea]WCN14486.1 lipid A export permease/ATP-binding protein MsbA [Marinomonas mediterranea]WCN18537.1 lipid A export permease/ATP-binding protein MsbA [Marinomonas mediterranea MMB-1]